MSIFLKLKFNLEATAFGTQQYLAPWTRWCCNASHHCWLLSPCGRMWCSQASEVQTDGATSQCITRWTSIVERNWLLKQSMPTRRL